MKLIMPIDIADGLPFPCIYYNGRQPLVAIRAIKDARIDKSDYQTRIEKYIEKEIASKDIQMYTQSNSTKKVVPLAIEFTTKSDFAIQNCNHRRNKTLQQHQYTNVVQFSKTIGSCAQKAKNLVVTAEFRTNNLPLIMISEPGQLY